MSLTPRADRGSALMLMPAAVLIVFVLGSIALDFSLVYLRQRQAFNLANDAANAAVIEGADVDEFRDSGTFVLDPDRVSDVVAGYAESADFGDAVTATADIDGTTVVVTVTVSFDLVFAGVVPGADTTRTVSGTATGVPAAAP